MNKKVLIFLALLLIKLSWTLFINQSFKSRYTIGYFIANSSGDTKTYIEPIENYLSGGKYGMNLGEYSPFKSDPPVNFYPAIRTPHYGIFYFIFRLFFPQRLSFELLAILQLIVEVLAVMVFATLVQKITKRITGYYLALFFLGFSSWITFYTGNIETESFTCSFIIFGFYFYYKWLTTASKRSLLASGSFIAYAILMKPFLFPWILFFAISILIATKKFTLFVRRMYIFGLPLVILWTPWIIRNYSVTNDIIPFAKPTYYPCKKVIRSCSDFMTAWGGDPNWWEGKCNTAGTYFYPTDINMNCEYKFPDFVFTPDYSLSDFKYLRDQIMVFQSDTQNDSLDEALSKKFDAMRSSFIRHNPFRYYVVSPLMRIKYSFIRSGSYYIDRHNLIYSLIKYFQSALYVLPLILGGVGLIFFGIKKWKNPFNIVLISLPFSLIIILPVIFKLNDWRYFIHVYPILILFMIQLILKMTSRRKRKLRPVSPNTHFSKLGIT